MMSNAERRVRRPADKVEVLEILSGEGSPFPTYRDAMVFAAALGYSRGRRVPFERAAEPIRWDVMVNRRGTEALLNMLSAATAADDPEVLRDERFEDRVLVFEEYANGGLEILAAELDRSVVGTDQLILAMILESLREDGDLQVPDLTLLA